MASPKQSRAKILLLDIETAYKVAAVWDRFNQNITMNQLLQDSYVLCWAAKWLGKKHIAHDALYLHRSAYRSDPTNDKTIIKTIWKLLDQADYVVAHNGKKFDVKILNARFAQHGLRPPSPYTVIDTLTVARRHFKFTSNRLDDLAKALGLGQKLSTDFELWKSVVEKRNLKAFQRMVAYNKQDVRLLESVYEVLKPWDRQHPNVNLLDPSNQLRCNACEGSHIKRNGLRTAVTGVYQQYVCTDCGHWMRSTKPIKTNKSTKLRST